MKILSQINVITNSSTEVFILDTPKTPEEIRKELSEFTTGFLDPKVIVKGDEFWDDFGEWSFFFDPDNEEKQFEFWWQCAGERLEFLDIDLSNQEEVNSILDIRSSWIKFLCTKFRTYMIEDKLRWRAKELMNGRIPQDLVYNKEGEDENCWDYEMKVFKEFIQTMDTKTLPKLRGTHFDMNQIIGKVCVVGEEDNSIPYDTWDKINSDYNGKNYHLG